MEYYFGGFVALILLGLFIGGWQERRHLRDLERREHETADMIVTQLKTFPHGARGASPPTILFGEAVIATDYLKTFFAKLRNIFGGRVGSYQIMLERARREALMRIIEQARSQGYNAVCNVRLETADVGGSSSRRRAAMAAILASATAYHAAPSQK